MGMRLLEASAVFFDLKGASESAASRVFPMGGRDSGGGRRICTVSELELIEKLDVHGHKCTGSGLDPLRNG